MCSWELLKRYCTLFSTRQSCFFTCGCFCVRGLIHHKPFWNITAKPATFAREKDSHDPGNFTPYSLRIRLVNVPRGHFKHGRYCETEPTVYSPYPRRLGSLTICQCNYKGSTYLFISYFKTLSVGPGRSRTHDLPRDNPMLN